MTNKASNLYRMLKLPENLDDSIEMVQEIEGKSIEYSKSASKCLPGLEIYNADLGWLRNPEWGEHYLLSLEACQMLRNPSLIDSINVMRSANLLKLPHKKCLIEYNQIDDTFFMLIEQIGDATFKVDLLFAVDMHVKESSNIFNDFGALNGITVDCVEGGLDFSFPAENVDKFAHRVQKGALPAEAKKMLTDFLNIPIRHSLYSMFALFGIRGIGEESVQPHKGHVKKAKRDGLPAPKPYRTVKLMYAVNKRGDQVAVNSGDVKAMHIRSAHMRNQRHGPGNSLVKPVFIEAVVVNYKPDEEVKARSTIVKGD